MSDRAFFDTNVLIYTLGDHDDRTPKAEALLASGGIVSVQVLNELASVASRQLRKSWAEVSAALADIKILCPSPIAITVETHDAALLLAVRYGYHIYDALIVAAALQGACSILYSEDLQDGQVIEGRLTIRNPFAE